MAESGREDADSQSAQRTKEDVESSAQRTKERRRRKLSAKNERERAI